MNVFITPLNFEIAACSRSQHAEVSICQRVAGGAFGKLRDTSPAKWMNPRPIESLLPGPLSRTATATACLSATSLLSSRGCGSSWPTSSFGAATNSFRHRKLGQKQSMTMLPPLPSRSSRCFCPACLAAFLLLLLLPSLLRCLPPASPPASASAKCKLKCGLVACGMIWNGIRHGMRHGMWHGLWHRVRHVATVAQFS